MPEIVLPIVHLNGTSCEELIRQRELVYGLIQAALYSMREMSPNGRDYYPEPGRLNKALAQHTRRCQTLSNLMDEIETEIGELDKHRRS